MNSHNERKLRLVHCRVNDLGEIFWYSGQLMLGKSKTSLKKIETMVMKIVTRVIKTPVWKTSGEWRGIETKTVV